MSLIHKTVENFYQNFQDANIIEWEKATNRITDFLIEAQSSANLSFSNYLSYMAIDPRINMDEESKEHLMLAKHLYETL